MKKTLPCDQVHATSTRSAMPQPDPWTARSRRKGLGLVGITLALALTAGCQRNSAATTQTQSPPAPSATTGGVLAPLQAPVALGPQVGDVASLVQRLKPTVVNITTSRQIARQNNVSFGGLPFGLMPDGPRGDGGSTRKSSALGTGFVVDPAGYVVTNAHVIEDADDIKVRFADEREFAATLVGKDEKLDLALLKVNDAGGLIAAALGDSDQAQVGESVLAIGNPYGLGHTVTTGIVSAKDRSIGAGPYDAFIQTDASINPGNSGGPLFDARGQVIGISTAIRQGAQGIGFAVPVNALKEVLPQLRDKGVVSRGKLGVVIQELTPELAKGLGIARNRGALISSVEPGGAAAKAGIQAGDVITAIDGTEIGHADILPRLVARHAPGAKVNMSVLHGGRPANVEVTLEALDEPVAGDRQQGATSRPSARAEQSRLGVHLRSAPEGRGAVVMAVVPGAPADGKLTPGDLIEEVNRKPVTRAEDVAQAINAASPGDVVVMRVRNIANAEEQGSQSPSRFVAIPIK